MKLSLEFVDNGSGHDDLEVRFGDALLRCDSYYLGLDPLLFPEREDAGKVRAVLRRLIWQWLAALDWLADGGTAYLPFDFADQYTAWLECQRSGDGVVVSWGFADVEGWALTPSAAGDLTIRPRKLRVGEWDGGELVVEANWTELLEAVRRLLENVGEG